MLRNRNFIFLWVVNIAATLAIELFTVTVLVTIFEQTDSTLQAAGTMVARTLPAFLLGPAAGVLVDRYPRKNVLLAMDVVRLVLVGVAIGILQGDGNIPVIAIYLILAGLSAAGVFHSPARLALIPSLVPREALVKANSFISASNQIFMAISYTLGGWLILSIPLRQIAFGVMVLFAFAILAAILMRVPKRVDQDQAGKNETFMQSLISGWRYLRQHPIARPLTIMETVEHLPHGIWTGAVMLAFTTQALRGDASDWGYQVTGYFSGMIVGSVGALALSGILRRYPGRIIVGNALLSGIFTLTFAFSQTIWMATILAFFFGPPSAVRDVAQDSLLQGTVEKGQLGRVYAAREMFRNVVFMFAGIFFAWLSDFVPIRVIYIVGGSLYLLTSLYAYSNKPLRESTMDAQYTPIT